MNTDISVIHHARILYSNHRCKKKGRKIHNLQIL